MPAGRFLIIDHNKAEDPVSPDLTLPNIKNSQPDWYQYLIFYRHHTLIGALQVWQGKDTETAPVTPNPKNSSNYSVTNGNTENSNNETTKTIDNSEEMIEEIEGESKKQTHKLDKIAIIVSPLMFLVFNIAYWLHYTA